MLADLGLTSSCSCSWTRYLTTNSFGGRFGLGGGVPGHQRNKENTRGLSEQFKQKGFESTFRNGSPNNHWSLSCMPNCTNLYQLTWSRNISKEPPILTTVEAPNKGHFGSRALSSFRRLSFGGRFVQEPQPHPEPIEAALICTSRMKEGVPQLKMLWEYKEHDPRTSLNAVAWSPVHYSYAISGVGMNRPTYIISNSRMHFGTSPLHCPDCSAVELPWELGFPPHHSASRVGSVGVMFCHGVGTG